MFCPSFLPCSGFVFVVLEKVSDVDLAHVFGGNRLLTGSDPIAHCYCGHQFGKSRNCKGIQLSHIGNLIKNSGVAALLFIYTFSGSF